MKVMICMCSSVLIVSLSEVLLFLAQKTDTLILTPASVRQLDVSPLVASLQETTPFCQFSHHQRTSTCVPMLRSISPSATSVYMYVNKTFFSWRGLSVKSWNRALIVQASNRTKICLPNKDSTREGGDHE
jgi:hypothetical protein